MTRQTQDRLRKLERRVERLERNAFDEQRPTSESEERERAVPRPGPGYGAAPTVTVTVDDTVLRVRAPAPERWKRVEPPAFERGGFFWVTRYAHDTSTGLGLRVFWTVYDSAPRAVEVVRVIENGQQGRGCIYFDRIETRIGEELAQASTRADVLLPRGLHALRVVQILDGGEASARADNALKLTRCDHLPRGSVPEWAPAQIVNALKEYDARPTLGGLAKPWWIHFHDLSDSHGGAGISPYDGEWTRCPEGWRLAWAEMLGEVSRSPLLCTDEDGKNLVVTAPYWCGRTTAHQLPGYTAVPDGRVVGHGPELYSYKPHDFTHLWRGIRKAAMLAPYSPFARWWLGVNWHDLTLWLEGGGADSGNRNLWPLEKLIDTTPRGRGAWWGGRGLAHAIRCFLRVEPYLDDVEASTWRQRWRTVIGHIALENGVTLVDESGRWGWARRALGVNDAHPMSRGFETMLMLHNYEGLGLDQLLEGARDLLPEDLGDVFDPFRPNEVRSDSDTYPAMNGLWRPGVWGYPSPEALVEASRWRGGPNGSSQDLDRHPRAAYARALPVTR